MLPRPSKAHLKAVLSRLVMLLTPANPKRDDVAQVKQSLVRTLLLTPFTVSCRKTDSHENVCGIIFPSLYLTFLTHTCFFCLTSIINHWQNTAGFGAGKLLSVSSRQGFPQLPHSVMEARWPQVFIKYAMVRGTLLSITILFCSITFTPVPPVSPGIVSQSWSSIFQSIGLRSQSTWYPQVFDSRGSFSLARLAWWAPLIVTQSGYLWPWLPGQCQPLPEWLCSPLLHWISQPSQHASNFVVSLTYSTSSKAGPLFILIQTLLSIASVIWLSSWSSVLAVTFSYLLCFHISFSWWAECFL